ncbi:MAG: glycosyltransferase family protein [Burkholderiales bacterium]|nr:glycosyltransferase family protein [Burkholderiales bacterium]
MKARRTPVRGEGERSALSRGLAQAQALHRAGRLPEAERLYRELLRSRGHHPDLVNALASLCIRQGRAAEAVPLLEGVLRRDPGCAEAHHQLGNALDASGRPVEAMARYRQATVLDPAMAAAHNNLGRALAAAGYRDEACLSYERAIALRPDYALAHYNLGNTLSALERKDEAIASYRRAIAIAPEHAESHNNLGNAFNDLGRFENAIASYREAIRVRPGMAEAHHNLGATLKDLQRHGEALASLERALDIDPGHAGARFQRSTLRLALGEYETGWPEYEWRWRIRGAERERGFREPLWLGSPPPAGKTILVHAEQGYGDTLQFVRYAPHLAALGARVILEVQRPLARLLQGMPGIATVVARGEALPPFDLQCPMMSLPLALGTTLASIPAATPYLAPPRDRVAYWRAAVGESGTPGVGLCWAGSSRAGNPAAFRIDRRRSLTLAQLAPLAAVGGVRFFSLQKGPAATQAPPAGMTLVDRAGELEDFADTAALVAALDLVISVDTAVAHLAAALGKPVWMLSRFDACWRWLTDRDDSPWYPTLRLYRQETPGDWSSPISRLAEALARLAA